MQIDPRLAEAMMAQRGAGGQAPPNMQGMGQAPFTPGGGGQVPQQIMQAIAIMRQKIESGIPLSPQEEQLAQRIMMAQQGGGQQMPMGGNAPAALP